MIPEKIGPYEIKSELGRGGMATVYRAYDPRVDREVAIKVLPRELLHDPQFHVRFEREIKMVAKLEHPAIVPIYDVGEIDGQPYYVMRLMPGGTLSDWIKKGGFSLEDTARIIERLAAGLSYAHKHNVIHRDLKPGNILFDQSGDPYLSDFGVAKFMDAASNVTGSAVIGTPAYMSPEQAQSGNIDARSDVYGLGAIVYEMLSGIQPYSAETPMGVVVKHITEPVPEILHTKPDLPEAVDTVIKTAMAKDRDKRYETTSELSKALTDIAEGKARSATVTDETIPPPQIPEKTKSSKSRNYIFSILIGLVFVAAIAGLFIYRDQIPFIQSLGSAAPADTEEPPLAIATPTQEPAATEAQFAPICSQLPPKCEPPAIEEVDKFCVSKVPYTLLTMPKDVTYEALGPDLKCATESTGEANQVVSCSGAELFSYNLKVCDPTCTFGGLTNDPALCPEGHGYYAENNCCAPLPPGMPPPGSEPPPGQPAPEPGCIIFQVDTRGCN